MLRNGLINELYKLKRSGIFWLTTVGTLVSNLIFLAVAYVMKMIKSDLIESNVMESWESWVNFHYQGILPMLLPMYLVILCALAVHQEKRYRTWKVLAVMPIYPRQVFISKLLIVIFVFVISHLIFVVEALG